MLIIFDQWSCCQNECQMKRIRSYQFCNRNRNLLGPKGASMLYGLVISIISMYSSNAVSILIKKSIKLWRNSGQYCRQQGETFKKILNLYRRHWWDTSMNKSLSILELSLAPVEFDFTQTLIFLIDQWEDYSKSTIS